MEEAKNIYFTCLNCTSIVTMSKVTRHLLQMGKVMHGKRHDFVKVKIVHMVFNDRFRYHFNEPEEHWVLNKGNAAQQGDIVLLKELPEAYAIDINLAVHKIIFPTGSTIDPVTGKRCLGTEFIDDIQKKKNLAAQLSPKSIGAA